MSDEPKYTDCAVGAVIYRNGRILLLWRNKWEEEGTPLILPGGGVRPGETSKEALVREVAEEIALSVDPELATLWATYDTKWCKRYHVYLIDPAATRHHIVYIDEKKFSGFLWLDPSKMNLDILSPLMMPAAKKFLTTKFYTIPISYLRETA
jgi:ADP-ribose pyrophosphatase YjhB (NUDIX family)